MVPDSVRAKDEICRARPAALSPDQVNQIDAVSIAKPLDAAPRKNVLALAKPVWISRLSFLSAASGHGPIFSGVKRIRATIVGQNLADDTRLERDAKVLAHCADYRGEIVHAGIALF